MGNVVLDITASVDGYVAGPNPTLETASTCTSPRCCSAAAPRLFADVEPGTLELVDVRASARATHVSYR